MDADTRRLIEERLLTTQELAALLEVPAATVQQWASRHKVDWVLKGRTYLFDREDFRDFERPGNAGVPGRKSKATTAIAEGEDASAEVDRFATKSHLLD